MYIGGVDNSAKLSNNITQIDNISMLFYLMVNLFHATMSGKFEGTLLVDRNEID